MPNYKGHIAGGVITYLVVLYCIKYTNPSVHTVLQGLVFCLFGSLFPDVDVKSKGQKIFYYLLFLFLLYCLMTFRWEMFIVASFLGIVPLLVRHRGIFHKIWFLLGLTLLLIISIKSLHLTYETLLITNTCFFFAGCVSHVLLDQFFTKLKRYV